MLLVAIAKKGSHYHKLNCSQVVNNPEYILVQIETLGKRRNRYGKRYTHCDVCWGKEILNQELRVVYPYS